MARLEDITKDGIVKGIQQAGDDTQARETKRVELLVGVWVLCAQAFDDTAEEQEVFGRIKHECRYRSPNAMLRATITRHVVR